MHSLEKYFKALRYVIYTTHAQTHIECSRIGGRKHFNSQNFDSLKETSKKRSGRMAKEIEQIVKQETITKKTVRHRRTTK